MIVCFIPLPFVLLLIFQCNSCFSSLQHNHARTNKKQPSILFIMADDLGWNDVSWHNPKLPTSNIHHLAKTGVILNNYYVNQVCTQTRSALFTGYYPYHIGTFHGVFHGSTTDHVPLKFTFMSEHLQRLGYHTHMVGKWHLGYCNRAFVPTGRGFDSFFGYYMGAQDYFTHARHDPLCKTSYGLDFWDDLRPAWEYNGTYSTDLFASKAIDVIKKQQRKEDPFFLYLAFQAVHSPLEVPENYMRPCLEIRHIKRRAYCGMLYALDVAVGKVVKALKETGQYQDTVIIFSSDVRMVHSIGSQTSQTILKTGPDVFLERGSNLGGREQLAPEREQEHSVGRRNQSPIIHSLTQPPTHRSSPITVS